MKEEFESLNKLSNSISYFQTFIARVAGVLLMAGLIVATANLLNNDDVFRNLPWLRDVWGWFQAGAVDSGLAVIFLRLFSSIRTRNILQIIAYSIIGSALFFVAFTITGMESLRQALNTSLDNASALMHMPLLLITLVRAFVAVSLVAVSGIDIVMKTEQTPINMAAAENKPLTKKRRRRRSKQVMTVDKWNGYAAPPEDVGVVDELKPVAEPVREGK